MPRLALFADVQNIYYTTRQIFGRPLDYRKLWARLAEQGEIVEAHAYAIDRGDPKQRGFQQALRDIGFHIHLKPYIQRGDGSAKGDWDVGIALDVMEAASEVERIILLSGDGDFDLLLERIRQRFATESEVYGVAQLTAASLIRSATQFHAIDEPLLMPPAVRSQP